MGSVTYRLSESLAVIVIVIWAFFVSLCPAFVPRVYPYKVKNISILFNYDLEKNMSLAELDKMYGTFHSLKDAFKVIEKEQDRSPKVREMLDMFNREMQTPLPKPGKVVFPYFVLEGIEESGTVRLPMAIHMANCFYGMYIKNPPEIMLPYYPSLRIHSSLFRRAYYVLGNYLSSHYARITMHKEPVFMDRSWQSITAYSLAKTYCRNRTKLPLRNSSIYYWPDDLLKPDIVFFLHITRRSLILRNRDTMGTEKQSRVYRLMRGQAHKEFRGTELITINANYKKKYIYRIIKFRLKRLFHERHLLKYNEKT